MKLFLKISISRKKNIMTELSKMSRKPAFEKSKEAMNSYDKILGEENLQEMFSSMILRVKLKELEKSKVRINLQKKYKF